MTYFEKKNQEALDDILLSLKCVSSVHKECNLAVVVACFADHRLRKQRLQSGGMLTMPGATHKMAFVNVCDCKYDLSQQTLAVMFTEHEKWAFFMERL